MGGRRNARGPVYSESCVAAVDHLRLPGVDAHPNPHLGTVGPVVFGEGTLARDRPEERVSRPGESDEEGVPLGVDDGAAVLLECRAQ